jgi:hypothetical protein
MTALKTLDSFTSLPTTTILLLLTWHNQRMSLDALVHTDLLTVSVSGDIGLIGLAVMVSLLTSWMLVGLPSN